jgi:hypothetical protein
MALSSAARAETKHERRIKSKTRARRGPDGLIRDYDVPRGGRVLRWFVD